MRSRTDPRFRRCAASLPPEIKKNAREAFKQFSEDPYYPSLRFKKVHSSLPIFSVRISIDYRAVGIVDNDEIVWFWIGSHADYERLLKSMK